MNIAARRPDSALPRRAGRLRYASLRFVCSAVAAAALAAVVLWSLAAEALVAAPAAVAALAVFLALSGWWRTRPVLAATLVLDVAIVGLYLWSLGEQLPVTIRSTPSGYLADMGGNVAVVQTSMRAGALGLYSGGIHHDMIQPDGVAPMPQSHSPLIWLGDLTRFAVPGPGWRALHVSGLRGGATKPASLHGYVNARGEIQLPPGTYTSIERRATNDLHFSAELLRADGAQGIVIGRDAGRQGYLLNVQMDQRYGSWLRWDGRPGKALPRGRPAVFAVGFVPMLQRTVRAITPSALLALLLAGAAVALAGTVFVHRGRSPDPPSRLPTHPRRRGIVLADAGAVVIALCGALVAAYVAIVVFRGVPNVQDGVAYLFQARTLALGHLWLPTPHLPSFFHEEFILVYDHHWFGKYPLGWPVLLALGVLVHQPQLVNPILFGLVLLLLYWIGRALYGRPVALVGAVLATASPMLLIISGTFFSETATLFYLLGGSACVVSWLKRDGASGHAHVVLIPAGLLYGMAAITRPLDALAFAAPFGAAVLLKDWRRVWWIVPGAAVPALLALGYNHAVTGQFFADPYTLVRPWDHLGFGTHVGGPLRYYSDFTPARALWNLAYDVALLQAGLFGFPYYFGLALAAVPFVLGRANRWDALIGVSSAGVIIVYLFYFDPGEWMAIPRYDVIIIPWLALLAARGLAELAALPVRLFGPQSPRRALAALIWPALLLAVLLLYDATVYLPSDLSTLQRWNGANLAAPRAVEHHSLKQALVFQVQNPDSDWWPYGGVFNENAPRLDSGVVYARDEGTADCRLARLYPHWPLYRLDNSSLTPLSCGQPRARRGAAFG